jgi:peptide chain release factor subunit 1
MPAADAAPTTAAESAGADTLERLARLDWHGHRVLSVYIDLDPSRFPTPGSRSSQLGSLLDEARRQAGDHAVARVQEWLDAEPTLARGARGVAIFSSAEADIFEAARLASPVEPLAVLDTIPWLEPLAAAISPGDWGVAVVSRRAARLLRGGASGLSEFATVEDQLHRRHAQGGWSQARFQRGIEEQVAAHARGVARHLLRAHRRSPFTHLAIACSGELRPVIERSLPRELAGVLTVVIDADLEHAPAAEIANAVAPAIERAERDRELELITHVEQALGTGGPAAAGLDEVLSTLQEQRVAILLVPEHGDLKAGLCPTCGRLATDGERRCPLDDAPLAEVDGVEHALEEAERQSAQVVVMRHRSEWLREHGEIAALLRW